MKRTKPKQALNLNQIMIGLIAILAVILVVVICVAVNTHGTEDPALPDDGQQGQQGDSGNNQDTPTIDFSVKPQQEIGEFTTDETITFEGVSDPEKVLTVNGTEVSRDENGKFICQVALELGNNEVVFAHRGEEVRFQIYRRSLVASYAPMEEKSYNSGATIYFEVCAKDGSQVSVSLNGKTVSLKVSDNQLGSGVPQGFVLYTGEYALPSNNTSNVDLGVATYTVEHNGLTETYTSGKLTCLKANQVTGSDPGVTPTYGDYIDVGSGYIAEIITYSAETFDGDKVDDYSHPTNNYLPKGTVDYCSAETVKLGSKLEYALLRCGRRVYVDKKNQPSNVRTQVVDFYKGTLPDHNEIGVASMEIVGNQTVLTLDCLWKAPFYFDILPQTYAAPNAGADRSYVISKFTATYVDITFCYATKFTGNVVLPEGNTPFKSAELIRNEKDCTLRLHLKKTGGFYGWDSYYNDAGQLCFQFLNPAKVTAADNAYGADLSGVTVMIDVGHGGVDGGTVGTDANGDRWSESGRNMDLAYALRTELESMGATVIFNREGKVTLTVDERLLILKNAKPDYCVAVHHNSVAGYPDISGYLGGYYTPFSMLAAKQIGERTDETGVYKSTMVTWWNYYVARQTCCPVVLTENGYMTNLYDLNNTLNPEVIQKKAVAIAQGIADYFLLINE